MPDLFLNAHRALMKTRGVVASVVRTDETQGSVEIGVLGNVAVYMLEAESSAPISFLSVPAVIGGAYRLARPETHAFGAGDMLVLCTDGIQARPDLQVVRAMSADAAAEYIVRSCGKETDDAAAAVIKMSCGALRPASPRDPIVIPIRSEADAKWVSDATRGFAKRLGMPLRSQWEMAIVATEVAINVLRQSRKATASLRHVDTPIEALVLEVSDEGPGLPDIQQASAGAGMLHRLSDEVTVESEPGRGTRIRAIKYVKIR